MRNNSSIAHAATSNPRSSYGDDSFPTHLGYSRWESLVIFLVMYYMRSSDCPLVNNGNYFRKLTSIAVMKKSCCCWFRVDDTESQVNTRSSVMIFSWYAMLKQTTNKNVGYFYLKEKPTAISTDLTTTETRPGTSKLSRQRSSEFLTSVIIANRC